MRLGRSLLATIMLGLSLCLPGLQAEESALRDPTRPWPVNGYQAQQPRSTGSYTLNSTLVSSSRRIAVINGQHVTEGQHIDGAIVLRIGKYDVELQSPDKRITLKLVPDIVKKSP